MAWPPSSGAFGTGLYIQSNLQTIRWGTDGINPFGNAALIVISCTPSDEIEPIYVENGTGLRSVRIILWQGRRVNFTVVDDSTITPPTPGQTITYSDPLSGATFASKFVVIENSYNAARKEPGQRVIVAEFLTNVEGAGSPPTP